MSPFWRLFYLFLALLGTVLLVKLGMTWLSGDSTGRSGGEWAGILAAIGALSVAASFAGAWLVTHYGKKPDTHA